MLNHSMVAGQKSDSCSAIQRAVIATLRFTDGIQISELIRRGENLGVEHRNGHHEWFQFICKGDGNMHKSQQYVFQVVQQYAKSLFDRPAIITGGYPRDLHYGIPSSDVDITVPCGDIKPEFAFEAAVKLTEILASSGCRVEISQAYEQASGDFNERIHVLIQVHLTDGYEVDIMLHRANNLTHVFDTYDSNINQVWLNEAGEPVWHAGHPPTECLGLKDLTPERILRLHNIASRIGLPIVAESFSVKPSSIERDDIFPF